MTGQTDHPLAGTRNQAPGLTAERIRVALAEDSYIVREGIEQILAAAPEVEIVASCRDMDALLDSVERLAPAVVLTDIRMPPTETDEGIRIAAQLRRRPGRWVVVLSQHVNPAMCSTSTQFLRARACSRARPTVQGYRLSRRSAREESVIDPKVVAILVQRG